MVLHMRSKQIQFNHTDLITMSKATTDSQSSVTQDYVSGSIYQVLIIAIYAYKSE